MTTLYTLDPITGATVRVPIDLDNGAQDWRYMQPWTEPPSCVRTRRYATRRVVMTCNRCGFKKLQCSRGTCHRCREGVMTHTEGKVKILVRTQR